MAYSNTVKPVTLPLGRAMLATKPEPTGSMAPTNTIGTVRYTSYNASTAAVVAAKTASGARVTNSAAYVR
jgi:hypothetical protein